MTDRTRPARAPALLLALAATAITMLAFAAAAQAARDPIASGITDLHLKKGMARKLANNQIAAVGLGAGTVTGNKIGLTVREGMFDPTDVEGHLETRGGFKLERGRRTVPVTQISVNTVTGSVYAKIAKAKMQLATFVTPTSAREGFGCNFKATQLTLTEKAARRISNRLGLKGSHRIAGGRVLSNLYAIAQPSTVTLLPQGYATLAANTATLAKFKLKGVEVPTGITAVAPATEPTPNVFQFAITGGALAPDGSVGVVGTAGGIQILKTNKTLAPQLTMKSLIVDLTADKVTAELEIGPTPPFPGNAGRSSVAAVTLPDGAVVANPTTRQIEVKGEMRLQAAVASTLNDVFNQPPPSPPSASNFVLGDPLGTFALTAQAQ